MATVPEKIATNGREAALRGFVYEYDMPHLDEAEVLERYTKEKARHPHAVVTIDKLDCSHFEVNVYETDREKQFFYQKRLARIMENLWNALK
jgi:hypothetical protein